MHKGDISLFETMDNKVEDMFNKPLNENQFCLLRLELAIGNPQ